MTEVEPVRRPCRPREKTFICSIEDCKKAFSRGEHLARHALNHEGGDNTCPRCCAHFKRKDLLDRHLDRHRQKDEEAGGGEGSGVLNTRKRRWKDKDGNVVTKRPAPNDRPVSTAPIAQESLIPLSPPTSAQTSENRSSSRESEISNTYSIQMDDFQHMDFDNDLLVFPDFSPAVAQDQNHAVLWDLDTQQGQHINVQPNPALPYDDIFNPDTASSFNMPFTTMSNYNWLFDLDISQMETNSESTAPGILRKNLHDSQDLGSFVLESKRPIDYNVQSTEALPTPTISQANTCYFSQQSQHSPASSGDTSLLNQSVDRANINLCVSGSVTGLIPDASLLGPHRSTARERFNERLFLEENVTYEKRSQATSKIFRPPDGQLTRTPPSTYPPRSIDISDAAGSSLTAKASMQPSPPGPWEAAPGVGPVELGSCPIVDEMSRQQILALIDASRPANPDGSTITREHPLLSLASLQTFSDLYWRDFNVPYPLLHQPSFEPSKVESLLLVSILLLGASYSSSKDAHQLAVCIHDVLRPMIFSHASFSAQPELWILQTVLLVECFGKSRAGRKQHDMSHLFHGLLINLIRRSDCQVVTHGLDQNSGDLEDDWRIWTEAEQKRRLVFLCFMWDTQHAVLFCQSLCMSAFELRATLPCDSSLWEANSALAWDDLRKRLKEQPLFLSLLKSMMTPGSSFLPRHINGLSRVLLLHGLMSISWDMHRRDQTSLGLVNNDAKIGDWRFRMGRAYDAWKVDFDSHCMDMAQSTQKDSFRRKEVLRFSTAYNAIYHAAHIILNTDFLDLQIYAGARHILGRAVGRTDYIRSKRVVQLWIKDHAASAGRAAWHAAHILRDGIMNLDDFQDVGLFHYPWCLYLANVVCWAFHHARPAANSAANISQPDQRAQSNDGDEDDEIVWHAKSEMNALISSMTSMRPEDLAEHAGRRRTDGLTAIIAQTLGKVRWAVIHDAMCVLRGLVPWRLINQYEASSISGQV